MKGRVLKPCIFYRFNLSEKKENFERFSSLIGFSIKRKQDKLNQLIQSYLPTRYKWPKEREQVLKLKGNESYTNIIKTFSYISPHSIQNWLYHEKNK